MMRQAIRGLVLIGLFAWVVDSSGRAQNAPDKVEVRDRKDGTTKKYEGVLKVSPAGFQVFSGDKGGAPFSPDDIVKITIGDLPGVDRGTVLSLHTKEEKKTSKDYAEAVTGYQELLKMAKDPRSKRYLAFKVNMVTNKVVDDLDEDKGWKEKAEACIKDW